MCAVYIDLGLKPLPPIEIDIYPRDPQKKLINGKCCLCASAKDSMQKGDGGVKQLIKGRGELQHRGKKRGSGGGRQQRRGGGGKPAALLPRT